MQLVSEAGLIVMKLRGCINHVYFYNINHYVGGPHGNLVEDITKKRACTRGRATLMIYTIVVIDICHLV